VERPRLLVLNQYYWPALEATGQLLTDLCEGLADAFDVTVVTGMIEGEQCGISERNGVRIMRVSSTFYDRRRLSLRTVNYLTYTVAASWRALRLGRPDVVFCMTDPPFLGTAALGVARRFGAPLVVTSQDVFPEIAVEVGRLHNPAVVETIRVLVGAYLRRAERVVAIGDTMRERLEEKGARPERMQVISNWVDTERLVPQPRDNDWARAHGLDDDFVVMHSGNIGYAQDLDTLLRAGALLRDLEDLRIVIIGAGARFVELTEMAERLELDSVIFLPYQSREVLTLSLSAASIHFVGLARGLAGYVVPSRLYGILSVGRPVLVAADPECETAEVVTRIGAGVAISPGNPVELARVIREAHDGKLDLAAMGARGRAFATAEADREVAVSKYRSLFAELIGPRAYSALSA
jgi:glycosyltransferase involved in cell wall biosynthesis